MLVALYMNYQDEKLTTKRKETWRIQWILIITFHKYTKSLNAMGIKNPFDKYKFRELQVGSLLGHTVFEGQI